MFPRNTLRSLFCLFCMQQLILGMPLVPSDGSTTFVDQPCLRVDNGKALDQTFPTTYEAAAILLTCSTKQGTVVTHFSGQRSSVSSSVLCDNTPLISFDEEADRLDMPVGSKQSFCQNGLCVFFEATGNQVLLSALISEDQVPSLRGIQGSRVPFLRTTLSFAFDGMLQTFASRMLSAFAQNVSGEIDLRAIAFLSTSATTCSFPVAPCFCQS